jgi:hypothetical protein
MRRASPLTPAGRFWNPPLETIQRPRWLTFLEMSSSVSGDADGAGAADDRGDMRRSRLAPGAGDVGSACCRSRARCSALETADDLGLGLAFGCSALGVGARAGAVAQAADGDQVQRAVGVAVAAVVETVAGGLARGRRDRAGPAERGERALTAQALDVLPGADEQLSGVAGRDARAARSCAARRCGPAARAACRARRSPRRGSGYAAPASVARSGSATSRGSGLGVRMAALQLASGDLDT